MSGALVLALDCSTTHLAVALVDGEGLVLASRAPEVGREHAARLPLEFADLLVESGRRRTDIGEVRVGVGPGSYTGTRVAIAAAKGLARALGVPLAGVSSFVALAAGVLGPGEAGVVTLDARRGNVYAQACRRDTPDPLDERGPRRAPRIVTLSEVVKLPLAGVDERFAGLAVRPAGAPDAAAMAVSAQTGEADALYL